MSQMLVGLVLVVLIIILNRKTELASVWLCCIIMELSDNTLPQFRVQQNSLITLTEGKCLSLFPFQRPKTKQLRTVAM